MVYIRSSSTMGNTTCSGVHNTQAASHHMLHAVPPRRPHSLPGASSSNSSNRAWAPPADWAQGRGWQQKQRRQGFRGTLCTASPARGAPGVAARPGRVDAGEIGRLVGCSGTPVLDELQLYTRIRMWLCPALTVPVCCSKAEAV